MKHVLYILFFFIAFVNNSKAQKACCPEFRIVADYEACEKRDTSGTYGQKECNIRACKNSNQVYTVFPIKTGYSYTWTISGGTLLNSNTNPVKIKWGTGTEAVLQVIITSPDKSCKDTIKSFVCLTDAPVAGFGFVPGSPVCKNQLLQFNNTSAGAMSYSWNFGDGTASNQTNPSHSYTAAGTYIVTLAVSTDTSKTGPVQGEGACACRDTTRKIIVVKNEDPLQIESGCKKMLCKGDTATYCTPNNCNNYNWSVTGGRISGSTSGKCITVIWDGSYPATVTLNSNCGGSCGNTATINVPVLYPNMNILGPVIVCPGSLSNYSLPAMPGTFYKWTITGSGTISGFTENTNNINVLAQNSGSFTINCAYQNPATKCSGTASITVQIKPKFKILGPKKVCVGDTEPYKVIDNSPANWTLTPNTGITPPGPYNNVGSINITWHKPGTYKLFASPVNTNNFCSYPDEIQIIVNDTPKLNAITGSKMICPGSSAVYKISSNINDGTFYWTPLNGVKQCLGSRCDSVMVTWNATGPYSIKVHQITDAGCSSSDKELAVDTFPKPIINGPQQVCADAEATYTATGPVPASGYNWTINSLGSIISGQGTNSIKVLWSGGVTAGFNTAIISISTCAANTNSFVVQVKTPVINLINKSGSLCSPGGVTLTSANAYTNYAWSWGNTILPQVTQTINAVDTGKYTVICTDVTGCKVKATIMVGEENPLVFTITANNNLLCSATGKTLTANFPGASYQWYLNNVIISAATNQSITITIPGTYSVLVVKNKYCKGIQAIVVAPETLPLAHMSSNDKLDYCLTENINIQFSAITGVNYCYQWYKNGVLMTGLPSSTQTSYTTTSPGTYHYVVRICGTECKITSNAMAVIQRDCTIPPGPGPGDLPGPCNNNYTVTFNSPTCNPQTFTATSSANLTYQWDFGDGSPVQIGNGLQHTFTNIGTYNVKITTWGNGNCLKIWYINTVVPSAANFLAYVNCDKIILDASPSVVKAGCNILSYNWSLSSGPAGSSFSSTTAPNSVLTVSQPGTYAIKLNITTNCGGCPASSVVSLPVNIISSGITAPTTAFALDNVNFSAAGLAIWQYQWDFGDGSLSNQQNPKHAYCPGTYLVKLKVKDIYGCELAYTHTITITQPAISISAPAQLCTLTAGNFSVNGYNSEHQYKWEFGDSSISNQGNITHSYASQGIYTVKLTVQTDLGCTLIYNSIVTVVASSTVSIGVDKKICVGGGAILTATPSSFTAYQWYKNGVAIQGANASTYNATEIGTYSLEITNSNGCKSKSTAIQVIYHPMPVAKINKMDIQCNKNNISLSALNGQTTYAWTLLSGPGTMSFSQPASTFTNAVASVIGEYQVQLKVTNTFGCIAYDTVCITVAEAPTVTISTPSTQLCEGTVYTFTANPSPVLNPDPYMYFWNDVLGGNTFSTGMPGSYSVTVINQMGCKAKSSTLTINRRPDVSLFPVGCDTLCLTDTLKFPLPLPYPSGYNINWFDDDGTAITNVGSGFNLPLSNLHPGIHHLYCTVSFAGNCSVTTGKFDLYVKDCTLLPVCDNCTDFFKSALIDAGNEMVQSAGSQIFYQNINITISKPAKEIRLSLSDLQYYWKDSACINCKVKIMERGCMQAATSANTVGTLLLDNSASGSTTSTCKDELVWKGGTPLQPGTYTIPIQLSLPNNAKQKCQLVIGKLCYHLTLIDTACRQCIKPVCFNVGDEGIDKCKCNAGNTWTSLYMIPTKLGIPKPRNQILCNSVLTDIRMNTPYLISGVFHCQGTGCLSSKNEINVYNQVNDITYTRVTAALHETISFNSPGYHTVQLIAWCGTQKCVCNFRVYIEQNGGGDTVQGGDEPQNTTVTIKTKIDSVLDKILPPDFNGGILVSQNDTVIYEKYISYKDSVNSHSSFDLASITKTFTSMAILKLMEDGKISLEDAVNKYLPQFPVKEVTIKMLLTHTSGLEDYLKFMYESDWDKSTMMNNADLLNFISNNRSKVLINTPGKVFDYSNTNFALLALIIEKISGRSYSDFMAYTFFRPLKMDDTYVLSTLNAKQAKRSYYVTGIMYVNRFLDFIEGDKCIYSTVQDLRKWDKGLRTMFKKSTLELAYATNGNMPAMTSVYALGWKTIKTTTGLDVWYHLGWWAGNRSIIIRLPKGNIMITAMSNNNHTSIAEIRRLCDLFGDYKMSDNKVTNF